MKKIAKLPDVVAWRLCVGWGACSYICPSQKVTLFDYAAEGIRPVLGAGDCGSCRLCLEVCPGVESNFSPREPAVLPDKNQGAFKKEWGPVLELWEGHATDPDIRFKGSSGGAITAISAYCVEVLGMHGVLHIGQDPDGALYNRTRLSRTRDHLLRAAGSRYSPASVCDGLGLVENAPGPCAVIGKPAEIVAVEKARKLRPALDKKVGVTISFFCAESPSTQGTEKLLDKLGVAGYSVADLKYRGYGWPGNFAPYKAGESEPCAKMPYRESWAFLQSFRPWAVQLWPDGTGELADISFGDPWYEKPDGENPGFSLVAVRSARGREILRGAMEAGYLTLTPAESWKLPKSQGYLLRKKGEVWGRRLAMHALRVPVSTLKEANLGHCWGHLSFKEKVRAVLGTIRRILKRKIYRPLRLDAARRRPAGIPFEAK